MCVLFLSLAFIWLLWLLISWEIDQKPAVNLHYLNINNWMNWFVLHNCTYFCLSDQEILLSNNLHTICGHQIYFSINLTVRRCRNFECCWFVTLFVLHDCESFHHTFDIIVNGKHIEPKEFFWRTLPRRCYWSQYRRSLVIPVLHKRDLVIILSPKMIHTCFASQWGSIFRVHSIIF